MNELEKQKLQHERRYGVIEFTIETLFDLSLLKSDVAPVAIFKDTQLNLYKLNCVSEKFDPIGEFDPFPIYQVVFNRDSEGNVSVQQITKL